MAARSAVQFQVFVRPTLLYILSCPKIYFDILVLSEILADTRHDATVIIVTAIDCNIPVLSIAKNTLFNGFIPTMKAACKTRIINVFLPTHANIDAVNHELKSLNVDQNNEVMHRHQITSEGENILYILIIDKLSLSKTILVTDRARTKEIENPFLKDVLIKLPNRK